MRKIGKKSTLKGYYNQTSNSQAVNTNLEKKTQEKIKAMSLNESLTMDFVLKNRKLLEHLKKCKVFLSKSMRKNLLKKYAVLNNPINRVSANHPPKKKSRPKKLSNKKPPVTNVGTPKSSSPEKEAEILDTPKLRPNRVIIATPHPSKASKKETQKNIPKPSKQNKSSGRSNEQSPGPIFIRFPRKMGKRSSNKHPIFTNTTYKANLTKAFGRMVFKCHVRVKRLQKTDPLFTKKFKTTRKTVSFMETVEVFGESDVEYESEKSPEQNKTEKSPKISRTSTPLSSNRKSQVNNKNMLESKHKKNKENLKSPASVRNSRRSKSPPKETTPNRGKSSSSKKPKLPAHPTPIKPRSPKKSTSDLQLSLIEGKDCFVKLNRSTSRLLSGSSDDFSEAKVVDAVDLNREDEAENSNCVPEDGSCVAENTELNDIVMDSSRTEISSDENMPESGEEHQQESEEGSLQPLVLENENEVVEINDSPGGNIIEDEICIRSDTSEGSEEKYSNNDNVAIVIHDDRVIDNIVVNLDDENDTEGNNEGELLTQENLAYDDTEEVVEQEVNDGEDDDEQVNECKEQPAEEASQVNNSDKQNSGTYDATEEINTAPISDQLNGSAPRKLSSSTSASESFHSINESKEKDELIAEPAFNSSFNSGLNSSDEIMSTPLYTRGKFDKIDRIEARASIASSGILGSKTNGTKKQNPSPLTIPETAEDLFDLLKSNKLPEPEPALNRLPLSTLEISEDEDVDPADELENMGPSPVPDLLDESDSANDSRFSLNTFFKSMKEKLSAKRSSTASPGKPSPSVDELNLKNSERASDSPATHEITTQ